MKTKAWLLTLFLIGSETLILAQEATEKTSGGGTDWMEVIFAGSIFLGVFAILPMVIYTNYKEKLHLTPDLDDPLQELSEEERNEKALFILDAVDHKLSSFKDENGNEMITIEKGAQAKFIKSALEYLYRKLSPTDPEILAQMEDLKSVYENRTERFFTGSLWILIAGIGVGAFIFFTAGFTNFIFIQAAGVLFYFLASRTPLYQIENRMKTFGSMGLGVVSTFLTAMFVGDGTKYYTVDSTGHKERDWETEGGMGLFAIVFTIIAALFVGLMISLFGLLNAVINYYSSYQLPVNLDSWYDKNIEELEPA